MKWCNLFRLVYEIKNELIDNNEIKNELIDGNVAIVSMVLLRISFEMGSQFSGWGRQTLVITLFALMQQEKGAASSKLISSTSSVIFRSSFSKAWTSFFYCDIRWGKH